MIRRFLTRTLMLILIAACGYNGWQVHQLQGQVARLQSQAAAAEHSDTGRTAGGGASVDPSWLGQADRHAALARAAALRADFPTAQRELQRGVDDMHRAIRGPERTTRTVLGQAQHTLAALQSQTESLWRKVHPARPVSTP